MTAPIALLATLAVALVAPPQDPDPEAAWFGSAHRRTFWSERARLFLDALDAAAPADRERAEAWILAARPDGAGASWVPSAEQLAGGLRELTGIQAMGPLDPRRGRERRELQAVVDTLDLVLVPPAFPPRSASAGPSMTCFVRSAWRPLGAGPLDVRLLWVDADGRATRARAEPGQVDDLRAGFAMYLRPPASEPGRWRLVPELEQRGVTVRGVGLAVECSAASSALRPDLVPAPLVPEPLTRAPLAPGQDALAAGLEWLEAGLRARASSGVRTTLTLGLDDALDVLATGVGDGPRPIAVAYREQRSGEARPVWGLGDFERAGGLLVVLGPSHESADFVLAGALGARWAASAERLNAAVVALSAAPSGASRTTAGALEVAIEAARALGLDEGAWVVVVARGQATPRLALEPPEGMDGFVLSTVVRSSNPSELMKGTRRLLVAPGGAEPMPPEEEQLTWIDGSDVPLLNDLALPGWIEAWLARR